MSAKLRVAISVLFLVAFCGSIDIYLWRFDHDCLPIKQMRIWYNTTLAVFVLFFIMDELFGYKSYLHQQYNLICKITTLLNIILVLLTHMDIIDNLFYKWLMFNGSVIATAIIITLSCFRHGTFSTDEY